jgi:AcrR family transcriptional regulator
MVVDKKSAILKSVLKLVNRQGFYHLNMKSIAKEAGIAAGTIYLYFKSKEELINDLYGLIAQEFNQTVLKNYNDQKEIKENFFNMLDAAVGFYMENPDQFSFIEQYTYAPFLFKENQDQNFSLLLPIYKMMGLGKQAKIIKNIDDAILLSMIHGSLNTMIKLHLAKKTSLKTKNKRQQFYNAIWEAITIP